MNLDPGFIPMSRRLFAAIVPALVMANLAQFGQGSEEAGGLVTGPLLHLFDMGSEVLLASLVISVWASRAAAPVCILGAVLCLPAYSYKWAPGVFRSLFPGTYALVDHEWFALSTVDIIGSLTLIWTMFAASDTIRAGSNTVVSVSSRVSDWLLPQSKITDRSRRLFASTAPAVVATQVVLMSALSSNDTSEWGKDQLLAAHRDGALLLLMSLLLSVWKPRTASLLCILGSSLCLPMFIYLLTSGLYGWVFLTNSKTPAHHFLGLDPIGVAGLVVLLMTVRSALEIILRTQNSTVD